MKKSENKTIEFDNPVERIRKAQARDQLRMTQQSAYTGIDGYSCSNIESSVYKISRRKIIQDPYNLPKRNVSPGQVAEFADRTAEDILSRQ